MVINALKEYYGASIGVSGERQNSFPCCKTKRIPSRLGRQGFAIKLPSVSTKIALMN